MKVYDKWLQWDLGRNCNLDCDYCFDSKKEFNSEYREINIDAVMNFLRSSVYKYRIGLTGGEPFLIRNIIEFCEEVTTAGHIISINSNLLSPKLVEFERKIDPANVLFIHASYHHRELEKFNRLEKYLLHYKLLEKSGFNIYAEAVLYPGDIGVLREVEINLNNLGIKLKFAPYIGRYEGDWYPDSYSDDLLRQFNIAPEIKEHFSQKGEICNAGYSAAIVDPDGDVRVCFNYKEKLGNITEAINWNEEPLICQHKKCGCPLNKYDKELFDKFWR
ncbi:MAG: hypothetical protein SCALA702_08110 [Melioribacteraceae bacterium]|nr:MAG: hypothetical protein SCALA702_08110 [Melioribacteraceae bacterium]